MLFKRRKKKKRISIWHRWFAWWPVPVSDTHVAWLQFVLRRGHLTQSQDLSVEWEYCKED